MKRTYLAPELSALPLAEEDILTSSTLKAITINPSGYNQDMEVDF